MFDVAPKSLIDELDILIGTSLTDTAPFPFEALDYVIPNCFDQYTCAGPPGCCPCTNPWTKG